MQAHELVLRVEVDGLGVMIRIGEAPDGNSHIFTPLQLMN